MKFERIYFDTNFYRELSQNMTTAQIKSRFTNFAEVGIKNNIDSHIHIFVIFELLSHLSSIRDKHFENCKNAILAINYHCRDSISGKFKYVNDFDSELIDYFFEQNRNETNEVYDKCSKICDYILNNQNDVYLKGIGHDLQTFTSAVEDIENDFIEHYDTVISQIDPSVSDWHLNKNDKKMRRSNLQFLNSNEFLKILARNEVIRLANLVNVKISEDQTTEYAKFIIDNFVFPLVVRVEIIRRIIESGYDLSKNSRGNWVWDIQIASCVYTNKNKGIIPYIFVTSDKGILKIAEKYDLNKRIISKQDYVNLLHLTI